MAAGTITLVSANPNRLCYSFAFTAGQTVATLAFTTYALVDAVTGPLKTALLQAQGQCTTNAKAISAVISGESFVGGGPNTPTVVTRINSNLVTTAQLTATAAPVVSAVDSGAGDSPDITVTADNAAMGTATGFLFIVHVWSPNM